MNPELQKLLVREFAEARWQLIDDSLVDAETAGLTLTQAIDRIEELGIAHGLIDPLDPWMSTPSDQERRRDIIRAIRAFAKNYPRA